MERLDPRRATRTRPRSARSPSRAARAARRVRRGAAPRRHEFSTGRLFRRPTSSRAHPRISRRRCTGPLRRARGLEGSSRSCGRLVAASAIGCPSRPTSHRARRRPAARQLCPAPCGPAQEARRPDMARRFRDVVTKGSAGLRSIRASRGPSWPRRCPTRRETANGCRALRRGVVHASRRTHGEIAAARWWFRPTRTHPGRAAPRVPPCRTRAA